MRADRPHYSIIVSGSQGPGFTNATSINPLGFIFGTDDDAYPITFSGSGFTGAVSNYQRWDFSFSQAVVVSEFILQDLDSLGNPCGFRDIIASESFSSAIPGSVGTGITAAYAFSDRLSSHRFSLNSSSFEVTNVPEPGSALLGMLSLATLFRRRR